MAAQSKLQQLIAGDVGFGTTTLFNGEYDMVSFRSLVVRCEPALANYTDKTGSYLVGDDALSIASEARKSTDTRFFDSEDFRILLMYGIQVLGAKNPKIITGLPNEFFDELKVSVKKRIMSFSEYLPNDDQINSVTIIRQPMGTVWSNSLVDIDGKKVKPPMDKRVAVIDGGDGTTDISEFFRGVMVSDSSEGVSIGGSDIHKSVMNTLRSKKSIDAGTTVHDIDRAIRNGTIWVSGAEVDPRSLQGYKKGVEQYTTEVQGRVSARWQAFNKIHYVILTGGVVDMIGKLELVKKLKLPSSKVLTPSNPSQANAKGYMAYLITFLKAKNLL